MGNVSAVCMWTETIICGFVLTEADLRNIHLQGKAGHIMLKMAVSETKPVSLRDFLTEPFLQRAIPV